MDPSYSTKYTTVVGYFLQDDLKTNPEGFDYSGDNFGLIERSYPSDEEHSISTGLTLWQRFEREVNSLNQKSNPEVKYKVLYIARHGQGVHNVAERKHTREMWNRHYAKLEGDGTLFWADAHLTNEGIAQAQAVNRFWTHGIQHWKLPAPQAFYTSPLHRCLETARLTFSGIGPFAKQPFAATVKEFLREVNGKHTCDRRSTKTNIHEAFPDYIFEPGFSEEDNLWTPDERESNEALETRLKSAVDDIFWQGEESFISISSHALAISGLLRVVGHREFRIVTGSVIPVLVKGERLCTSPTEADAPPRDVSTPLPKAI